MSDLPPNPPLDSLLDLACRDGVDIRPTLLRVLTDLYVQRPAHTAYEETQYVELALGLIDSADAATLAAVAASLRGYAAAPAVILGRLAGRAAPNRNAPPSPAGAPVQPGPATDDLVELFFSATSEERRLILANLDVVATAPHTIAPGSADAIRRLEAAALQRNTAEFSLGLEDALSISGVIAERITHDISGEPLVVVAKALGMAAPVLQRVLLFLNPAIGQSVARVFELANLYETFSPQAAAQMAAIWRGPAKQKRAVHEPVHWDDERRSARSLASPARHRGTRERPERPAAHKATGR